MIAKFVACDLSIRTYDYLYKLRIGEANAVILTQHIVPYHVHIATLTSLYITISILLERLGVLFIYPIYRPLYSPLYSLYPYYF